MFGLPDRCIFCVVFVLNAIFYKVWETEMSYQEFIYINGMCAHTNNGKGQAYKFPSLLSVIKSRHTD